MNSADALSHSLDTSAKLKLALDTFQLKVMHEADLDVDLAKVREQIARISSVRDAVQNKLDEMDSESDLEPIGHLELFLNSMESPPFLESMESELAEKVSDLKRIASEQLKTIQMLQKENKEMKLGEVNQRLHSGNDVLIVRLEKILLDQNRSVKTLENKLNSLHTIRHNLNIDLTKKEEVIDYKGKVLEERSDSSDAIVNMKGLIERKHETMQSMEDLLHSIPLTVESDEYSTEQGKRLSELRLMVSESELYVEMLERDLDSVHEKREQYELILSQQNEDGLAQNGGDPQAYSESLSRLQVLEKEASELQLTLTTNLDAISRVKKMTTEIDEMEEKIEAVTAKYVELEEKYLTTLIM
ncbi:hypothetical protein O1D97_10595 [Marinomonas sp. 15G1-11]|uniref:Uncharacterized protein n=1 Tax=Marinomonas phaeophyticola TaxID=3004091 RepID=A0ABT4JUK5_9GAMM|nr:hypothetical protein [Marinomonas sp. 15G1-11]MCZ2722082.1 hypothetical protein [Marinomonas sp. 15G1-11]